MALPPGIDLEALEESMQAAARMHGPLFELAYKTMIGLNPRCEFSRSLIREICTSPNPGEALVSKYLDAIKAFTAD